MQQLPLRTKPGNGKPNDLSERINSEQIKAANSNEGKKTWRTEYKPAGERKS